MVAYPQIVRENAKTSPPMIAGTNVTTSREPPACSSGSVASLAFFFAAFLSGTIFVLFCHLSRSASTMVSVITADASAAHTAENICIRVAMLPAGMSVAAFASSR